MYTLKAYKSLGVSIDDALRDDSFTTVCKNISYGGELDTILRAFKKGLDMFGFIDDVKLVLFDSTGYLCLNAENYGIVRLDDLFNANAKPIVKEYRYEIQYKIVGFIFYTGTIRAKTVEEARQLAYDLVYIRLTGIKENTVDLDIDLALDHIKIYENEEV